MEINGTVTSGFGKAAYFLNQDFYKTQFKNKCGFIPYPGTLNLTIPKENMTKINNIKDNCNNVIKSDKSFGGVKYIKAKIENSVTGAIVFPDKTTHEENYLEFIAKDNLRKKLNLKDGTKVSLEIDI